MSRYSFASHHSVIGVLFFFCFFLHPVAWEVAPLNLKELELEGTAIESFVRRNWMGTRSVDQSGADAKRTPRTAQPFCPILSTPEKKW